MLCRLNKNCTASAAGSSITQVIIFFTSDVACQIDQHNASRQHNSMSLRGSDSKFEVLGSKFQKPRTSDLEPLSVSRGSPVSLESGMCSALGLGDQFGAWVRVRNGSELVVEFALFAGR